MAHLLSPEQVRLVQSTWTHVVPIAYAFSSRFYERLFTLEPSARALFAGTDMAAQGAKFVQMLGVMVRELSDPEQLRVVAGELGRRHTQYGVRPVHYEVMQNALLWTLRHSLGETFTPGARAAWAAAFASWSALMLGHDPERSPGGAPRGCGS